MVMAVRLFCSFLRIWLTAIVVSGNDVVMLVVMMSLMLVAMMSKVLRSLVFLVVSAIDAHCRPSHLDRQKRYQPYEYKVFYHFK